MFFGFSNLTAVPLQFFQYFTFIVQPAKQPFQFSFSLSLNYWLQLLHLRSPSSSLVSFFISDLRSPSSSPVSFSRYDFFILVFHFHFLRFSCGFDSSIFFVLFFSFTFFILLSSSSVFSILFVLWLFSFGLNLITFYFDF